MKRKVKEGERKKNIERKVRGLKKEGAREIGEKGLLKGSPRLKRSFHRLIVR